MANSFMAETRRSRGTSAAAARRRRLRFEALEARIVFDAEDPYEPNDSKTEVDGATAGGVNSSNLGTVSSNLSISSLALLDSADWYRVVTTDYGTSHDTARIDFTHNSGDLGLELYAANGTTLLGRSNSSWSNGNQETVTFASQAPGTYYLRVYGIGGATNASYSLSIDPPGNTADDAYEANDTTAAVDARPAGAANSPNLGEITSTTTW
ncbi:MAG TPA: PPC domain-containing protein, partial [Pirellulaceae bacterium]|nr:PPC domain-containing protein [Pirellulaceae bacterium]